MNKIIQTIRLANRAQKVIVGSDNIVKYKDKVKLVIVSVDSSYNLQKIINNKLVEKNVDVLYINDYDFSLSDMINKTNVKVIGICDKGFKDLILKLL